MSSVRRLDGRQFFENPSRDAAADWEVVHPPVPGVSDCPPRELSLLDLRVGLGQDGGRMDLARAAQAHL